MKGNKLERSVLAMSEEMGGIKDKKLADWLLSTIPPVAYVNKSKNITCMECGHEFTSESCSIDGTIECPVCHKKLKIEWTQKKHYDESHFVAITHEHKGWQVLRFFYVQKYRGLNQVYQEIDETMQIWMSETARVYLAKDLVMYPNTQRNPFRKGWTDSEGKWHNEVLKIKRPSNNYCGFNIANLGYRRLKIVSIAKFLKYRGVDRRIAEYPLNIQFDDFVSVLIKPLAEVIYKKRMLKLLTALEKRRFWESGEVEKKVKALKIALRHKYFETHDFTIEHKDYGWHNDKKLLFSDWIDTVEQVIVMGMDYQSPKYVCPDNLEELHHRLNVKADRKLDEQHKLEKLEEEKKKNAEYTKKRKKFFDINIVDEKNNFCIKVLQSVTDFFNEGSEMHHCVFNCGYYNMATHPDSLILSARKGKDWENATEILETVEVNLKDYIVSQARGHNNDITEYHGQIIRLVMAHMDEIERINTEKGQPEKTKETQEAA